MPRFLRSAEAEEDLIKIWLDIAQDNPAAADKLLRHIDEKFVLLAANPKLGRANRFCDPRRAQGVGAACRSQRGDFAANVASREG